MSTKTFCIYPWVEQVVLPPGTVGYCCVASEGGPVYDENKQRMKVPSQTLQEAWNSPYMRQIREKMLREEEVAGCKLCYYQEQIGKKSYRQMHNEEWKRKAPLEVSQRLANSVHDKYEVAGSPLYLDLRLGNLCNLKCRMCNGYNSTKIAAENEKLMEKDTSYREFMKKMGTDSVAKIPRWYEAESFWEEVKGMVPTLRKVYLTGGEPTLIKRNLEFLKYCVETGHSKHIFLMFNINGTTLTDEFLQFLPFFEFVLINVSIDGYGPLNSYIRNGSDWSVIDKNLRRLLQLKGPIKIGITPTIQIYNIFGLDRLLEYVENVAKDVQKQIEVDFLYVTDPAYLDIQQLPLRIKQKALQKIIVYRAHAEKYISKNKNLENSLDSLERALKQETEPSMGIEDFLSYTRLLDVHRNEGLAEANPQLYTELNAEGFTL